MTQVCELNMNWENNGQQSEKSCSRTSAHGTIKKPNADA
jgi:hypothetical protein